MGDILSLNPVGNDESFPGNVVEINTGRCGVTP